MRSVFGLFAGCFMLLSGCAQHPSDDSSHETLVYADATPPTSNTLLQFSSEDAFREYFLKVHALAEQNGLWWANRGGKSGSILVAQNEPDMDCPPGDEECDGSLQEIVTTGSKVTSTPSITNNQEAGVDEGDIVKRYRNFLVVLQDGRLFSIDMGERAEEMRLVDRINVYTSDDDGTWYDELLISGNKFVVTGFSYEHDATEISVLEIDEVGRFTWLTTYLITSQDYYSGTNYATRMVDGHLVIYTPMFLSEYGVDDGVIFPVYSQRTKHGEATFWQPLFAATDLFQPLQETLQPVVHTISVCPISDADGLACRSTGIVGPPPREFYVSEDYAYIWNTQDPDELWDLYELWNESCDDSALRHDRETLDSTVYRIPLFGGRTTAVKTAGTPTDQFSLDAREDGLHALLVWLPTDCWPEDKVPMKYVLVEDDEFNSTPPEVAADRYTDLPASNIYGRHNRFTEGNAAYTDTTYFETTDNWLGLSNVIVMPLAKPNQTKSIPMGFDVERLEVFGGGLVATGTLYDDGLYLSSIALGQSSGIADKEFLPGYFESEGRSHAFNLTIDENGSGTFGVPVAPEVPYRYWTRIRDNSDIVFFNVNEDMQMTNAGMILSDADSANADYECEVSCYDWYGNARPIFIDDRIFALSGSELIEGAMLSGQIQEIARLSLTGTPAIVRNPN